MSLQHVWLATTAGNLIRADRVIGLGSYWTPEIGAVTAGWLVHADLAAPGSPSADGDGTPHAILTQTAAQPTCAPTQLARLLSQLDTTDAAGIITPTPADTQPGRQQQSGQATVRFVFTPFTSDIPARPDRGNRATSTPGDRHDDLD